jgi:hypothetical protein
LSFLKRAVISLWQKLIILFGLRVLGAPAAADPVCPQGGRSHEKLPFLMVILSSGALLALFFFFPSFFAQKTILIF